jgi:hypothetical protein
MDRTQWNVPILQAIMAAYCIIVIGLLLLLLLDYSPATLQTTGTWTSGTPNLTMPGSVEALPVVSFLLGLWKLKRPQR